MISAASNLNLSPLAQSAGMQTAPSALLGNNQAQASFLSMFQKMPQTMQKIAHSIEAKANADLSRSDELALKIFLARMQKELGVKPAQVVEAFSKLPVRDMALPPETTADKFISELKLDHKGKDKARVLYSKLLGILATTDIMKQRMANIAKAMDANFAELQGLKKQSAQPNAQPNAQQSNNHPLLAPLGAAAGVAAATAAALNHSSQVPANAATAHAMSNTTAAPTTTKVASPVARAKVDEISQPKSSMPDVKLAKAANVKTTGASEAPAKVTAANVKTADVKMADVNTKIANSPGSRGEVPTADPKAAAIVNAKVAASAPSSTAHLATNVTATTATAGAAAAVAVNSKSAHLAAYNQQNGGGAGDEKQDKQNEVQGAQAVADAPVTQKVGDATVTAAAAKAQAMKGNETSTRNNVKEIISRAQFLAHKGGGEVKVSLQPEGLGEIKLRVNMQHGKMSVQMLASNDDAKNALQKSLGDLKVQLATHQIHLDSIRIDTPKDLAQQFLNHRHQQMEQNFQKQFLSDFQDRNNANRQSVFDFSEPEVPFSQVHDRSSNSLYNIASARKNGNRRLDLVA